MESEKAAALRGRIMVRNMIITMWMIPMRVTPLPVTFP